MPSQLLHGATILTVDPDDRGVVEGWLPIEDELNAELGRAAGVAVAPGTDNGTANIGDDMVAEMNMASHREGRAQPASSREPIRVATIGRARALGLGDDTGSLEGGRAADIAVFDTTALGWSETTEVEAAPVCSGSGRDLRDPWVEGGALVWDRRLVRQDFSAIRKDDAATCADFWGRIGRGERAA